jgi:hypothetical protein
MADGCGAGPEDCRNQPQARNFSLRACQNMAVKAAAVDIVKISRLSVFERIIRNMDEVGLRSLLDCPGMKP